LEQKEKKNERRRKIKLTGIMGHHLETKSLHNRNCQRRKKIYKGQEGIFNEIMAENITNWG
jgi:hypothetical protein